MKHDCHQEKLFDVIIKRFDTLEEKIDTILQWKWKVIGMFSAIGIAVTFLTNIFLKGV